MQISEVRNYFTTNKKQLDEQAEKLKAARPANDVSGSALLFGGMKATSRAEIMASLPSKYTTDSLVARYFSHYDPSTREYPSSSQLAVLTHVDILHSPTFQAEVSKISVSKD